MREGYDVISASYRDDEGSPNPGTTESTTTYRAWIDELAAMLPAGARVLDLGCGNGLPATRLLVERGFKTTGLDFSPKQLERARRLVPGANFLEADMATWSTGPATFDAVLALYSLIHLPLSDQMDLIPRLASWLRPGGLLLAVVGHRRWTGIEEYHGSPMFWDHAEGVAYERWLTEAGFQPLWRRFVPEGLGGHDLILARK